MGIQETIENHCNLIGQKAGINGKFIYITLLICTFFVFIGYFEEYITMCVGILLPAHFSLKAIVSERKDDDKQWLTYWTIFALFVIVELLFKSILLYIPFYFFLKLAFLIWLFLPIFQGATILHDKFICEFFDNLEKRILLGFGKSTSQEKKDDK